MVSILGIAAAKEPLQQEKTVTIPDPRNPATKVLDLITSRISEAKSRSQRKMNPLKSRAKELFPALEENKHYNILEMPWHSRFIVSKLIVFIHGLNSSPLAFSSYFKELLKDQKICYFAPYVYKKGYCKIQEAALPILEMVQTFAREYPDSPVILVGHSHGARIAAYIEQSLSTKEIRLISISGPHLGSKIVDWCANFSLESFIVTEEMSQEQRYDSPTNHQYLENWQQNALSHLDKVTSRIFFATADDLHVFPSESSFPNLPHSHYLLIGRESHVTILDAVKDLVIQKILT